MAIFKKKVVSEELADDVIISEEVLSEEILSVCENCGNSGLKCNVCDFGKE